MTVQSIKAYGYVLVPALLPWLIKPSIHVEQKTGWASNRQGRCGEVNSFPYRQLRSTIPRMVSPQPSLAIPRGHIKHPVEIGVSQKTQYVQGNLENRFQMPLQFCHQQVYIPCCPGHNLFPCGHIMRAANAQAWFKTSPDGKFGCRREMVFNLNLQLGRILKKMALESAKWDNVAQTGLRGELL